MTFATVSSTTTTLAYNGDGLRNSLTTGGNTMMFNWGLAESIPQVVDDGSFKYVHGLGRIAEVGPSTTTHYYLADGLGSTTALVNSSGSVVDTYDYDACLAPYAARRVLKRTRSSLRASRSILVRGCSIYARGITMWRREGLVIWILAGIAGLPVSQNRYTYVLNNPTNLMDPSGLCIGPVPCPKPIKKAGEFVSGVYHERKAAVQDQFRRDIAELKSYGEFLSKFATTSCLQFGLEGTAFVASLFGPYGLAVSAGLTLISFSMEVKEGDFWGGLRSQILMGSAITEGVNESAS